MSKEKKKMICPNCGTEMNRHADKLNFTLGLRHPNAVDPELGGIVEEIHTCPACGKTATRRSGSSESV